MHPDRPRRGQAGGPPRPSRGISAGETPAPQSEAAPQPEPAPSAWTLRPEDLPVGGAAGGPAGLDRLADNAAFRWIAFRFRIESRARTALVAVFGLGWAILGGFYLIAVLGMAPGFAFLGSTGLAIAAGATVGAIFLFAGIEGYESTRRLLPVLRDLEPTTISARDLALGVWGNTFNRRRAGPVRAMFGASVVALWGVAFLIERIVAHSPFGGFATMGRGFLLAWVLLGATAAGLAGMAVAGDLRSIALPGALFWTRGVRRGAERRRRPPRGIYARWIDPALLAVAIVVAGVALTLPPTLYLLAGARLSVTPATADPEIRSRLLAGAAAGCATLGWSLGRAWAKFARDRAERFARALGEDLERIKNG